jgi:hypothetical protein
MGSKETPAVVLSPSSASPASGPQAATERTMIAHMIDANGLLPYFLINILHNLL